VNIIRRIRRMCQRNEHFPYVSSPANGNFVLEFPDRRQVWLARMRRRCACWAREVSLTGSHIATLGNSSPVSRYLYIDLWSKARRGCKFPTEEIIGAQHFNFAPKFSQYGGSSAQNFSFLDENFPTTKRKFSYNLPTDQNLGGGAITPPLPVCPLPLPHCLWCHHFILKLQHLLKKTRKK